MLHREDMMAGIDHLVRDGVAAPDRIGVGGDGRYESFKAAVMGIGSRSTIARSRRPGVPLVHSLHAAQRRPKRALGGIDCN
jgi:hypothetical protein